MAVTPGYVWHKTITTSQTFTAERAGIHRFHVIGKGGNGGNGGRVQLKPNGTITGLSSTKTASGGTGGGSGSYSIHEVSLAVGDEVTVTVTTSYTRIVVNGDTVTANAGGNGYAGNNITIIGGAVGDYSRTETASAQTTKGAAGTASGGNVLNLSGASGNSSSSNNGGAGASAPNADLYGGTAPGVTSGPNTKLGGSGAGGNGAVAVVTNLTGGQDSIWTGANGVAGAAGGVVIEIPANEPPTTPGPIIYGRVKAGSPVNLACEPSADPEDDAVSYVWERRVDTGVWTQIAITDAPEAIDIVPVGGVYYQARVKAADTAGNESTYRTGEAVAISYNDPPVIHDEIESDDLGDLTDTGLSYPFTVTDDADENVAVEIAIDGTTYRQMSVPVDVPQTFTLTAAEWMRILNGSHALTITATDSFNESISRTLAFSRNQSRLAVLIRNPRPSEFRPTRMALNLSAAIPAGAVLQVLACNNAFDNSPVWEDVTQPVGMNQAHIFTNEAKTADNWAVNVLVAVDRNGAEGDCYVSGFALSYDTEGSGSAQIEVLAAQLEGNERLLDTLLTEVIPGMMGGDNA